LSKPARSFLRDWGPAIIWGVAISIFSTDLFSAANTSRFLFPLLQWLMPGASLHTLLAAHEVIRKTAHVVEYFLLALLVFRGFRGSGRGWHFSWAFSTVAVVVAYSALDEVHQTFVPTRKGSVRDVLIDTMGCTAAQVVIWVWYYFRKVEE